jgi:hypothetical protein
MRTYAGSLTRVATLVCLALTASGCEAIGTIFQAGVWTGAILVVLVLAVVGFIAAKMRRR